MVWWMRTSICGAQMQAVFEIGTMKSLDSGYDGVNGYDGDNAALRRDQVD